MGISLMAEHQHRARRLAGVGNDGMDRQAHSLAIPLLRSWHPRLLKMPGPAKFPVSPGRLALLDRSVTPQPLKMIQFLGLKLFPTVKTTWFISKPSLLVR